MKLLVKRIAEAACCAGCLSNPNGDCDLRQDCDRVAMVVDAVANDPIWGNYLVAPKEPHLHFYVASEAACKVSQAKARRRLEDLLRKDCSLCGSILQAVGIPIE